MASKMEHLAKDEWEKVMAADQGGFTFDFDMGNEDREVPDVVDSSDSEMQEQETNEQIVSIEDTTTDMSEILRAARCTIAETFCKNPDNKLATKEWDDRRRQFRVSTNKWLGSQQTKSTKDNKDKQKRKR
eukprot:TRINITY_DN316_c0_g1_i3.p1 TRINITY_DN316_c0_g1~~TRINITY_DN316_c0_g1_i3.p1  ORF type:complete len:130 (+),score=29.41 TRINITY_DN316_c0_g1_i3:51-440(+)